MRRKKGIRLIIAVLTCTMIFSSCSADALQQSSDADSPSTETVSTANTASALGYADEIDKTTIMTFEVSASPGEWQAMLDNAQAEEYIPADITINGTTIKNVGIRPKGNSSLSAVARDETTDRYSFKIKFDEYVKGQTWMGLDKIVLNNNYSDTTSMKEYLSYDIMSYMGVDAPLYAYANITVNNENWGFYLAVEDIDSGYLARVKNDEGELYKPEGMEMNGNMGNRPDNAEFSGGAGEFPAGAAADNGMARPNNPRDRQNGIRGNGQNGMRGGGNGVSLVYTDDSISSYLSIFDNAETKTDEADHQRVVEAIKNLNEGTDLEKYIDVDTVLRYLAAHTVVVNLDSYSGGMAHNYYLYENDGQISILPWDYNMAFGGFQSGNASSVVNFPIDTPVSGVTMEERPLISKLLEVPEYLEKYHQYLQEIMDGYFSDGKFEQKIDELNTLISEYVKNDPSAFYTFEEYLSAVAELKKLGTLRGESIQGQLDGTIPSTTDGQTAEPDKLTDSSSVDMTALGDMRMGGGFVGGGGGMPNMPGGIDMNVIQKALEIIQAAQGGTLTDEQRAQLHDLGLSDEQIEQMLTMPAGGFGGGFGGRRGN